MAKKRTRAVVSEALSSAPKRQRLVSGDKLSSKPSPRRSLRLRTKKKPTARKMDLIDLCDDDDEDDDLRGDSAGNSSQSLRLFSEFEAKRTYTPNEEDVDQPHHIMSLNYAMSRSWESGKNHKFFWVFAEQHGHQEQVFTSAASDYTRIMSGGALNDIDIDFMMHYIYASWAAKFKETVCLLSAFFWTRLVALLKEPLSAENREAILRLTRRRPALFERRYIVFPILQHKHWYLAIICNPGQALRQSILGSGGGGGDDEAKIIYFDSVHNTYKNEENKTIRKWLNLHVQESRGYERAERVRVFNEKSIKGYYTESPQQFNSVDCGCYLLRTVVQFGIKRGIPKMAKKKRRHIIYLEISTHPPH